MKFKLWLENESTDLLNWLKSKPQSTLTKSWEDEHTTDYLITTKLKDDSFIHFTLKDRALKILETKKILSKPPHERYLYFGAYAISVNFGYLVEDVQINHVKENETKENPAVAVKFKTNTFPHRKIGHPEEINWDRDVSIIGAEIIKVSDALNMLKNNKPNLKENDGYSIEYTR